MIYEKWISPMGFLEPWVWNFIKVQLQLNTPVIFQYLTYEDELLSLQ